MEKERCCIANAKEVNACSDTQGKKPTPEKTQAATCSAPSKQNHSPESPSSWQLLWALLRWGTRGASGGGTRGAAPGAPRGSQGVLTGRGRCACCERPLALKATIWAGGGCDEHPESFSPTGTTSTQ